MNIRNISLGITFIVIVFGILAGAFILNKNSIDSYNAAIHSNPLMKRQVVQVSLDANKKTKQLPSVEASKLPVFIFSLADRKFDSLANATADQIKNFVNAKIAHTVYAQSIDANISVNKEKRELIVQPKDIPNFTPGMYKLSLKLRTLEGEVNIDQDFTWGVIAVNTNKSIYKPGETAKIGIGVLNDHGDTLCKKGLFNHVDDVEMTVIDPHGKTTNFSLKDNTIADSGKCGANTVTNEADFQSTYQTNDPGIYQMKVAATVYGKTRQIEDYFKVDPTVQFDVERTSFPTRIYPEALYPVTFTVTAKQNYDGTIEDIVPAFFGIDHIEDDGQIEKDGNFTKIVWHTHLTAGQSKIYSYFIKFPMISPEFYLIGPIKIGNFQEARQWQIASDAVNSSSGVFSAEDNGGSNTWSRTWTGTTWSPALSSPPTSMSTTPSDSRWFSEASSPRTGEKLVAIWDEHGGTRTLYVFRWTGTQWGTTPGTPDITITPGRANSSSRIMDVAYEQLSGDAMFAYSDTSNQIKYYRRSNGVWDASASTAGTSTAPKSWVKLKAEAGSDNILMGYVNSSSQVGAMIWNGASWNNELTDTGHTAASGNAHETFAIAWETQSQAAMIMWAGSGTFANSIVYQRFSGSSWSAESSTGLTGYAANVDWVNAATDDTPGSNNIAIGSQNTGAAGTIGCDFAVWNGSSWTKGTTTTCTTDALSRNMNVAWEHGTGKAMWVYVASAAPKQLTYRTWQSNTFNSSATITGTESNNIKTVELYSDSFTVTIMCIITTVDPLHTANDETFDTEWDGSGWSALPTVDTSSLWDAVGGAADGVPEEAFGFGFDLNLETQAAYRWFANSPGTDTSVSTPFAAQDTAYKLTTANQQFRLRMLLYYPDSLASGGRSYILQYVDPGTTGSCASPDSTGNPANWADVPNVNDTSSTVAYYNNTSVASASAVTANATFDPTYNGATKIAETYNEQNTFTTNAAVSGGQVGLFDFSLIDKTTFGRAAHTFCFRVKRSSGIILQINNYPQITTASQNDVLIQGGSLIQGGTKIQ